MITRLGRIVTIIGAVFVCLFLLPWLYEDHTGDLTVSSLSDLKQIGKGLSAYTREHHGTLPPMQDIASLQAALTPAFVSDARLYTSPFTGTPFRLNAAASGRNIRSIPAPAQFVVVYEDRSSRYRKLSANYGRCVLFLDGHVAWATEKQWPRLERLSRLP